jgi:hypothetical protein
MRYQAEPGNEGSLVTRGKGREKSEAEPLDMRYQAEPVNEESHIKSSIKASNLQACLRMRK